MRTIVARPRARGEPATPPRRIAGPGSSRQVQVRIFLRQA